jgi:polysaccharide deacetylase 2 family uncharacterized protein YibQ
VAILGLAALIMAAAVVGLGTTRGQAFAVRCGIGNRFLPMLGVKLEVALARNFAAMGLAGADLGAPRRTRTGVRAREYVFEAPRHLTPSLCNLWITRAAQAAGASVLRCEEWHHQKGAVALWLGFGSRLTHHIVVNPVTQPLPADPTPPRIALVIDDFGHAMNATANGVLGLDVPLTIAVLPDLRASSAAFKAAQERGRPALLHLPMEPEGKGDPGKQPIHVGMSDEEIEALIDRHYKKYPSFVGVNNHMGSHATTDFRTMRSLAGALGRRELFFFDSMTTPRSVAYDAARQRGIWSVRNDLFLDDRADTAAEVVEALLRLAAIARANGLAVGIAHPRPHTLEALTAVIPRLRAEGFRFVTLPELRDEGSTSHATGT